VIRPGSRSRRAESIQLAVKQAEGIVVASYSTQPAANSADNGWTDRLFSTLYACPNCQLSLEEIEPRTFSFNSPYGACPQCEGLGYRVEFDRDLIVPDATRSISTGAIAPWRAVKAANSGRDTRSQETGVGSQKDQVERFLVSKRISDNTLLDKMAPQIVDLL